MFNWLELLPDCWLWLDDDVPRERLLLDEKNGLLLIEMEFLLSLSCESSDKNAVKKYLVNNP